MKKRQQRSMPRSERRGVEIFPNDLDEFDEIMDEIYDEEEREGRRGKRMAPDAAGRLSRYLEKYFQRHPGMLKELLEEDEKQMTLFPEE